MQPLTTDVFNKRDFRCLVITRTFVTLALQSQATIVGWQIYYITKSTLMLGLTGLVEAVPALTCALFAGHIVDISRPHRVYMVCLAVLVLNTLLLFLNGGGITGIQGHYLVVLIYCGVFVSGIARSFIMPSSFTLLSTIVPRNMMPRASAFLTSGFQLAAVCGMALAGMLCAYGAKVAWLLPVSSIVIAFFALINMSEKTRAHRSNQVREAAVKSILAGWRFIWHNQVLLSVMALDMFAVLFGGATSMLPAFADQVLHVGTQGFGLLRAAPAIGSIMMAVTLVTRPFKKVRATTLFIAVTGFGLSIIGFGLSKVFWVAMLFLILSGMFDSVSMVIRQTLMQLLTPDKMRGRVSSVNSMFIISSNEIGAFESGVAARFLGLVPSIVIGGACTLGVVVATLTLAPKLRRTVVDTTLDK